MAEDYKNVPFPLQLPTGSAPLPPGVPASDFRISTLKEVKFWQAKIQANNSGSGDKSVGDWDEVGYVMVSIVGPITFIPIAQADEHRLGFELLWDKSTVWGINPRDYVAIYSQGMTGLRLYRDDIGRELEAAKRWRAAGGPAFIVASDINNRGEGWITDSDDFLAQNGRVCPLKGGIYKPGIELIEALQKLVLILNDGRSPKNPKIFSEKTHQKLPSAITILENVLKKYFRFGSAVNQSFSDATEHMPMPAAWLDAFNEPKLCLNDRLTVWGTYCASAIEDQDIAGIERSLFGLKGVKNAIHRAVREELKPGSCGSWMKELFGDLEQADCVLGSLDAGLPISSKPTTKLGLFL